MLYSLVFSLFGDRMLETKVINGYNLYNLYSYLFSKYMFDSKYKYVTHRLLKKYIAHLYVKALRGK